MSTPDELKNTVAELKRELASGEPLDAEHRDALHGLLDAIVPMLENKDTGERDQTVIVESLRAAAERFEASYPKLTLAIGAVADSLSRQGV